MLAVLERGEEKNPNSDLNCLKHFFGLVGDLHCRRFVINKLFSFQHHLAMGATTLKELNKKFFTY